MSKRISSIEVKCSHGKHEIEFPLDAIIVSAIMRKRGFVQLNYLSSWPEIKSLLECRTIFIALPGYAVPDSITRCRFISTVFDIMYGDESGKQIVVHVFEGDIL